MTNLHDPGRKRGFALVLITLPAIVTLLFLFLPWVSELEEGFGIIAGLA